MSTLKCKIKHLKKKATCCQPDGSSQTLTEGIWKDGESTENVSDGVKRDGLKAWSYFEKQEHL